MVEHDVDPGMEGIKEKVRENKRNTDNEHPCGHYLLAKGSTNWISDEFTNPKSALRHGCRLASFRPFSRGGN